MANLKYLILPVLCMVGFRVTAASNISPAEKYAWSENTGWFNFKPASGGVIVHEQDRYLSGYAWGENIGWIMLGSGNGPYANTSANDWGVNYDTNGACSGYAWSEEVGWINFGPVYGGVTVNAANGKFSGYAWGENIGWITFRGTSPAYGVAYLPVTATNAPVINCPCPVGFMVGEARTAQITASDVDEDLVSFTSSALPAGATLTTSTVGEQILAELTWTPTPGQEGIYAFTLTATDAGGRATVSRSRLYAGRAGDSLTSSNGIPSEMKNYTPIHAVDAQITGAATVKWFSVTGQLYDLYYSDSQVVSAGMPWTLLAEVQADSGALQYVDAGADGASCIRHYQVMLDGELPMTNGIYTLNRCARAAQRFQMMAPPVISDRSLTGEFGRVLSEALTGHPVGDGDKIHVLQPNQSFRTFWLHDMGVWMDDSTGFPVTDYTLAAGAGFFVERADGSSFTPVFDGLVGNTGEKSVAVSAGWNIVGISEGLSVPVKESFESSSPNGGAAEETSDQLFFLNADGSWTHLMYVTGWGAPYDGNWVDLNTFTITTNKLEPGVAVYYLRKNDPTSIDF